MPLDAPVAEMPSTPTSVAVAVHIGGIEALGLIGDQFKLQGTVWEAIGTLNDQFGLLGFIIIGVFAVSWLGSLAIYRLNRYDDIDVHPETLV